MFDEKHRHAELVMEYTPRRAVDGGVHRMVARSECRDVELQSAGVGLDDHGTAPGSLIPTHERCRQSHSLDLTFHISVTSPGWQTIMD